MKEQMFLILSHFANERIRSLATRARAELGDTHDVFVLGYFGAGARVPDDFARLPGSIACTFDDLATLGYPGVATSPDYSIVPGDCDMPVLWFARTRPQYSRFWVFEGDVDYTGSLREFVTHLDQSGADLLLTLLGPAPPDWAHFGRRLLPPGWPEPERTRLRGYLPAFRVSRRLLDAVAAFYAAGGRGHHEWVWPQVGALAGLECRDIVDFPLRGRTLYRPGPVYRGRSLGTFRFRPAMSRPGRRRDTLWHPVKDRPVGVIEERLLPVARLAMLELTILTRRVAGRLRRMMAAPSPGERKPTPARPLPEPES